MTCKACKDNFLRGLPPTSMDSGVPLKEDLITCELDQKDREAFRKFHEDVVKPDFSTPACQCKLVENAYEHLGTNKIPFDEAQVAYDCGETFQLPVPKNMQNEEMENVDVIQSLIDGHLDYLFTSTVSMPSIDQPGCGGCVCAGTLKWTGDEREPWRQSIERMNLCYLNA